MLTVRCWQLELTNSWCADNTHWQLCSICCTCKMNGKINFEWNVSLNNLLLLNYYFFLHATSLGCKSNPMELFVETCVRSQDRQKRVQQFVDNHTQHFGSVRSTILFCKLLFLLNSIWWFLFYFKRLIIAGWRRDMGMILRPIWIYGWT